MIRYGDLQLIPDDDDYLVIACDSSGGIGNKEMDLVKVEPELAGFFAAFVPLVEVLATKGSVLSLVDTLCVEMNPTGQRIINGICSALEILNIDSALLTGSTEDNIPTHSTGIGVTVIGKISKKIMEAKKVKDTHAILLIGLPKVGEEFLKEEIIENQQETLTLPILVELVKMDVISDMIPVGSKGIDYEAKVLSNRYALESVLLESYYKNTRIDYKKSAGPSTCLLVAIELKNLDYIKNTLEKNVGHEVPITQIGFFKKV